MALQAAGFVLPSPPPQSAQFPSPESAIPDAMAILAAMSLAWTADKVMPKAKKTPSSKAKTRREDRHFIIKSVLQKHASATSQLPVSTIPR